MGAGCAASSVTMALRGTVPLTSELVGAGAAAGAGSGVLDPHAAPKHAAITIITVVVRMNHGW